MRSHLSLTAIQPTPGAVVYFRTGPAPAANLITLYDLAGVPVAQPVVADAAGLYSGIYADDGVVWVHYGGQPPVLLDLAARLTADQRAAIEGANNPGAGNPFATATSVFRGTLRNYHETLYAVTTTGNLTLDLANGNVQRVTLDAARQLTLPASPGAVAQSFVLIINCAGFTPTWNSSPTIKWLTSDNAAPTLNTTAGKSNVITFVWENANSRWLGFLAGKEN